MIMTSYFDANLYHDLISGKSVSGILHFFNKTPIDWFTKKQSTVETATYGSEFVARKIAVQQIVEFRLTFCYLGVPVYDKAFLYGDSESMVKSCTISQLQLHKRHLMLSCHFVHFAIAASYVVLAHVNGDENPADILSKHWGFQQIWSQLQPLLFWKGDTIAVPIQSSKKQSNGSDEDGINNDDANDGATMTTVIPNLPSAEEQVRIVTAALRQVVGE